MTALPTRDDHLGVRRVLGNIPAPRRYALASPYRADELIPEAQWSEVAERYYPGMAVYDQDGKGACNAFASTECLEDARIMAGYEPIVLSAWFLYGNLTNGRDVGSNPEDALQKLLSVGTCRDSLVPYATFNPNQYTAAAKADAANFRCEIGNVLDSRQALMTAVLRREPANITMCVGNGYDQLDADGCVRVGIGWDNHALSTDGRIKRTRDGRWAVGFRNHWTARWADGGFAFVRLDDLFRNNSASSFTIRAPKANSADNPPPVI